MCKGGISSVSKRGACNMMDLIDMDELSSESSQLFFTGFNISHDLNKSIAQNQTGVTCRLVESRVDVQSTVSTVRWESNV